MIQVTFQRNLIALEDLLIGVGTANQVRGFTPVVVTKINGSNLPYDGVFSMQEKFDQLQFQIDNLPVVVDQFGNLLTGLIDDSALDISATHVGRLWHKSISATLSEIYYGAELLFQYNPQTGGIIFDMNAALLGTSTTSLAIGLGNRTFTSQFGKLWIPGMIITAVSDANPANFMTGPVISYSGDQLTIDVTNIGGAGAYADWSLSTSLSGSGVGDMLYSDNLAFMGSNAISRTNLGVEIGLNVQAWVALLDSIAANVDVSGTLEKTSANTVGTYPVTVAGKAFLAAADATAQRAVLGLGTAAVLNAGTGPNQLVRLNGAAQLPAVDGSLLTGITLSPAALTAAIGFSTFFASPQLAFTPGVVLTFAHGLASIPDLVICEIVNVVPEFGYSVGQRIPITNFAAANSGGRAFYYDATNMHFLSRSNSYGNIMAAANPGAGPAGWMFPEPTAANWRVVFKAWA